MTELWPVVPLQTVIVESLTRNNNAMFDDELQRVIQGIYGDLTRRELNKALMRLELNGLIHVSVVTKQRRRVELVLPSTHNGL
jgi:DNA-binding HxlR family transcriptional regulator